MTQKECNRLIHSNQKVRWRALILQRCKCAIPKPTRRKAGRYGTLETYLGSELGNSETARPAKARREKASVLDGGRRRRSSQMPSCNGVDKVKVRQGKPVEKEINR